MGRIKDGDIIKFQNKILKKLIIGSAFFSLKVAKQL